MDNLIVMGLIYGIPAVSVVICLWASSIVSSAYQESAYYGVMGGALAISALAVVHILIKIIKFSGQSKRENIFFIFRPLLFIVQLSSIAVILGNGITLVASSFFLPVILTGYYLPKLTGLLAIAAGYTCFKIMRVIFSISTSPSITINGFLAGRSQARMLWQMVDEVSNKLSTNSPERIVLSLDHNICVTEAKVIVSGVEHTGRTLILSIPLIKHLTPDLTRAIISHEMAHFSGGDTSLPLKFFPIFKGAQDSIKNANSSFENFGAMGIVALPATVMLNAFLVSFSEVEAMLSRKCEKEADLKAASIAGHLNLIHALALVHSLGRLWSQSEEYLFQAFHENGKFAPNIIKFYSDILNETDIKLTLKSVLDSSTVHPFNSHPTLKERIHYLGETENYLVNISNLNSNDVNVLFNDFSNLTQFEENLSEEENKKYAYLSNFLKQSQNVSDKKAA